MPNLSRLSSASVAVLVLLKEIFLLSLEGRRVTLIILAKQLGVTPPAISRRAQKLVRRGLLARDGACGLRLTETGRRLALYALRKQEIFEAFLVCTLGYRWEELGNAGESALRMDDELIERMYARSGRPARCPHGLPIPTREGQFSLGNTVALAVLSPGQAARVSHVLTREGTLLSYLAELGLRPGNHVTVVEHIPFGDLLKVRVNRDAADQEHIISAALAQIVFAEVNPAQPSDTAR
ncbi:MAG: metal-dependent transcriptional regulator [Anaerolineae bacterium]|nr:metal-dependent transcriptional regulator [Thermoflexales bacterium]MDW8395940.1 metal-dependent transcriptional regulator [Anaerolineae bacterium]